MTNEKMKKIIEEIKGKILSEAKAEIINIANTSTMYHVEFIDILPTNLEVKLYYEFINHTATICLDDFMIYAYIKNHDTGIREPMCVDVDEMTACLKIMSIIKKYNNEMSKFDD